MGMDDSYGDLAFDYEWLFPDETVGRQGRLGATSPGSQALLEAAVNALAPGSPVLDCSCGIGADAMALAAGAWRSPPPTEARQWSQKPGGDRSFTTSR
jgi:hypothetical protein